MLGVPDGEAVEDAVVEVADETAALVEAGAVVVEFKIVDEMPVEEGIAVALRVAEGVTDGVIVCRIGTRGEPTEPHGNCPQSRRNALRYFWGHRWRKLRRSVLRRRRSTGVDCRCKSGRMR